MTPVLTRITAPTNPVVSLDRIKAHCRVLHDDDNDGLTELVAAAVSYMDGYQGVLGLCLALQTWEQAFDAFPCDEIELALEPVTDITSVTYQDAAGVEVTVDPAAYEFDVAGGVGRLRAVAGWPATGDHPNAVRIRFVAGHAIVPPAMVTAVKMLAGHWYNNREGQDEVPPSVQALLSAFRRVGI